MTKNNSLLFLLFLALAAVYFFGFYSGGSVSLPGDSYYYHYPVKTFYSDALKKGVLPLWNPYTMAGLPSVGTLQSGELYPPNLIAYYFLQPLTAHIVLLVFHYAMACFFTSLFLRQAGVSRLAAAAGGMAFGFSGHMVAHYEHTAILDAATWLPMIMYLLAKLRQQPAARHVFALGIVACLQVLAGNAQICAYTYIAAGIYMLYSTLGSRDVRPARFLSLATAGFALGLLMALPQLQSTFELSGVSMRGYNFTKLHGKHVFELYNMNLKALPALVFPHLLDPEKGTRFNQFAPYVGIAPLVFAAGAVVTAWRGSWLVRFLTVLAMAGAGIAIMGSTPLVGLMPHLPVIGAFRAHGRALLLFSFAVSALFALALDGYGRGRGPERSVQAALVVMLASTPLLLMFLGRHPELLAPGEPVGPIGFGHPAVWPQVLVVGLNVLLLAAARWTGRRAALYGIVGLLFLELFMYGNLVRYGVRDADSLSGEALCGDYEFMKRGAGGQMFRIARADAEAVDYTNIICETYAINPHEPLVIYDYGLLFELEPNGLSRYWENLIMGNSLLSMMNVKYLLVPHHLGGLVESAAVGGRPAARETIVRDTRSYDLKERDGELRTSLRLGQGSYLISAEAMSLSGDQSPLKMDVYTASQGPLRNTLRPYFLYPGLVDRKPRTYTRLMHLLKPEDVYIHFRAMLSPEIRISGITVEKMSAYGPPRMRDFDGGVYRRVFQNENYVFYENLNALPRAFSVSELRPARGLFEIKDAFETGQLNPGVTAMVYEDDFGAIGKTAFMTGEVAVEHYGLHSVRMRVNFGGEGFLVLGDQAYPGWEAYVDGVETRIYTVDGFARGIVVPAGANEVAFLYRPTKFYASAAISLSVLAICLVGIFLPRRADFAEPGPPVAPRGPFA